MSKIAPIPSPYYRVAAKAIIKDDKGRLLVLKTDAGTNELPGGGWEHDETLQDCMRREIKEELGVEAAQIGETLFLYKGQHETGNWKVSLLMPVTLASTDFVFSPDDEVCEATFVAKEDLHRLNFSSDEAPILKHFDRI